MRPLTANDIVDEVGPQTYAANEVTRIYSRPGWEAGLRFSYVVFPHSYGIHTNNTDRELLV